MSIDLKIDTTRITARLEAMGPNVHQALVRALDPLAQSIAGTARDNASAHIRFLGKNPGKYLSSIYGGVSDKDKRVTGYVRSGNPLAHLLESGFTISDIVIDPGDIMTFEGDAGQVFARVVHRHETQVKPYPALTPAFEAHAGEIEGALTGAVKEAVR